MQKIEVIQVSQGILQWNVQVQPETARPESGRSHVGLAQGLTFCIGLCMRNPMVTPEQHSERKPQNAGKSIVDGSLGIAPWNWNLEWSLRQSADHVSSWSLRLVRSRDPSHGHSCRDLRLGNMQPLWMHPPTGLGFVAYSHPCKCLKFRTTQPRSIASNCNWGAPQLFSERCSISTDFFSHVLRKDVCHQSHGLWQSLLPTGRSNSAMQLSSTGFNLVADKRRRSSFVGKTPQGEFTDFLDSSMYSMNRLEEKLPQRMEKTIGTRHQSPHRQLEAKLWPLWSLLQPLSSQRSWKAVRHISDWANWRFMTDLWFDSMRFQNLLRPGIQTTKKWLDVKWLQLKVGDFRIPDLKNLHGSRPSTRYSTPSSDAENTLEKTQVWTNSLSCSSSWPSKVLQNPSKSIKSSIQTSTMADMHWDGHQSRAKRVSDISLSSAVDPSYNEYTRS